MSKAPLTAWLAALATLFVFAGIVAGPVAYAWAYWTTSNATVQPTPAMIADSLATAAFVAFLAAIAFFAGLTMFICLAVFSWINRKTSR